MTKEGKLLDVVRGDARFMQGWTAEDEHGNPVRVIDFIRGRSLYSYLMDLQMDHHAYFHTLFPAILGRLVGAFEAIAMIHERGYHHGDIRNDHILIDPKTDGLCWIDYDLSQDVPDYDTWSLGNVLVYVVGKGEHTFHDVATGQLPLPPGASLTRRDASAFVKYRVMNLAKLFPWIPPELNDILMRFSYETERSYQTVRALLDDLRPVAETLAGQARQWEAKTQP